MGCHINLGLCAGKCIYSPTVYTHNLEVKKQMFVFFGPVTLLNSKPHLLEYVYITSTCMTDESALARTPHLYEY